MFATFLEFLPETTMFSLGYYSKGRGNSKVYLVTEEDVENMYKTYSDPQQEVNLWCDGHPSTLNSENAKDKPATGCKRKRSTEKGGENISKRAPIREEVDRIMEQLQDKHGDKYSTVQFHLWANMLQLGTHRDYVNHPKCPMFGGGGKKKPEKKSKLVEALSGIAEGVMKPLTFPKESHQANVFICVVSTLDNLSCYSPFLRMVQ